MKAREVWELTVEALQTFYDASKKDATVAPEDAVEEVLAHCLAVSPAEAVFVRECVAGVTHYERLCEGALQGYCNRHKRNRADRLSMYLMAYVVYFCFDELGGDAVRELFYRCTSTPRIAEFVEYLVDEDAVRATALPAWRVTYDESFLDHTVFTPIARIAGDARARVVEPLRTKGAGGAVAAAGETSFSSHCSGSAAAPVPNKGGRAPQKKDASTHETSALHANKRRPLPPAEVREMIYTIPEPRPAPLPKAGITHGAHKTTAGKRKPPTQPVGFAFHHREAPDTSVSAATAHVRTEDAIGASDPVPRQTPQRLRAILDKEVDTRMTQAAILREAHTYRVEEQAQERALADKEYNPLDTLSYEAWRDEQRREEARQREQQVLEQHLDALRSRERAAEAKERTHRQRQANQRRMKQQQEKDKARSEQERAKALKAQRSFVTDLRQELEANRTQAQQSCAAEKIKTADEVRAENDRLAQQAKQAKEREQLEQAMIIEEIRQLRVRIREKQDALRVQRLEEQRGPSNAACATASSLLPAAAVERGNVATMNLFECRQELSRLREEDARLEEEKRTRIVQEREKAKAERQTLEKQLKAERERRRRMREADNEKRNADRQQVRHAQLDSENARMLELHDHLSQKRGERQREWTKSRNEERQVKNDLLLLAQDHTAVEQKRWLQQEHGATNRIAAEQKQRLAAQQRH